MAKQDAGRHMPVRHRNDTRLRLIADPKINSNAQHPGFHFNGLRGQHCSWPMPGVPSHILEGQPISAIRHDSGASWNIWNGEEEIKAAQVRPLRTAAISAIHQPAGLNGGSPLRAGVRFKELITGTV